MKWTRMLSVMAFVALAGLMVVNTSLAGKEEKKKEKKAASEYSEAEMKAMMEATQPGDHHKQLKHLVGSWQAKVTMWQAPGAEPQVTHAKSKGKMILGGRFVMQSFEGEMMGMPFEGMGMVGFDKTTGKHTSMWVDNMGTQMMYTQGECSNHCKEETHYTTITDPMGQQHKVKFITRIIDENKHMMEWYMLTDEGEFKSMEIVYTRG